jgi:hypothetical protein
MRDNNREEAFVCAQSYPDPADAGRWYYQLWEASPATKDTTSSKPTKHPAPSDPNASRRGVVECNRILSKTAIARDSE